jgi:preprotein translocase subunit SecD
VAQLVQQRFGAMERSASVEFEPGTTRFRVSLPSIDQRDRELFEGMLRSMGVCELFFIAEGDELEAERQKLEAWRSLHPGGALDEFNALDPEDQGPVRGLAWFRAVFRGPDAEVESTYPVRLPTAVADHLGAASFERVGATQDRYGYPALSFEVRDSRQEDFERLTGAHLNQRLAILIDGKIRSAPTLNSKLIGGGIIEGRFTSEEVVGMAEAFSKLQGPLRVSAAR